MPVDDQTDTSASSSHYGQADLNLPKQRDLKHHKSAYDIAKAGVDKANANLRNVCKQAEEAGVDLQAMKRASSLMKKDPLLAKGHLQQLGMFLQLEGYGVQIATYDAKSKSPEDEAKRAGRACAQRGDFEDNPYPAGSPPHDAFHAGWMEVQAENAPGGERQEEGED